MLDLLELDALQDVFPSQEHQWICKASYVL